MSALPAPPLAAPPGVRRRGRLRRAARGFAWLVLAAALVLAGGGLLYRHWSRTALPQVDGEARLSGLSGPVTVRRDARGIPHIRAGTILDAVRAQGYVTAQDRFWQMDLLRRRARGQLAEAFGAGALRADQEARTLGLEGAARDALELTPPDLRAELDAYVAGVNAWLDAHTGALPLEFRLLRYRPRQWEAVDTMAVGKLLALDLARGWNGEAFRAAVADRLPADVQELLFPTTFPHDRLLFAADADGGAAAAGAGAETDGAQGSNNWVVSGAHTASGKPLLANDPHLGLGVPSIWTAIHLTAPGLDVAGVTMPGTPGVTLGRNRHLAWGCTNVHDDSADLYVEEFDPAFPTRYRTAEGWAEVEVRREVIRVREGVLSARWREVEHPVRVTRRGPLVEIRGRLYALRWTGIERASELPAFLRLGRASSWDEFREALRLFPGPSQNFVYADTTGRIAWYSAGRLPVRRAGDGARPYPGASPDGDWLGFVPFEELPHAVDPPSGRLVTANNRLVGAAYPHRVGRGGIGPWRAAVLWEALEARGGWTADEMARLQAERLSIPHRDLARVLVEAAQRRRGEPGWDEIAGELDGWDGRLEADSRAAALAVATFRALGERVLVPRLSGSPFARSLARRVAPVHRLVLDRPAAWVPPGDGDWDGVLLAAWREAASDLTRRLGPDRAAWTWGAANRMVVQHPLARAAAPLGRLLSPPVVAMGGFSTTPNVLHISPSGGVEGPSMRFIANLADPDDTRLVNFMGQSGHPASAHYDDQFGPWLRAEPQRLPFTEAAVAADTRHTLRLVP